MNNFTIEVMETLINKGDLDDLFRRHLELAINSLLQAELIAFLDYEKYDHRVYPNAQFKQCCVHVSRNIAHKVRVRDRKEICDNFKTVYQATSKEEATN